MANKKFSEFVLKTNTSGVSHIVGYSGAENVQITPANFVTTGGTGIFLPLIGGTITGALTVNDILTAELGLAVTGGTVGSSKLVLASTNKVHLSGGSAGLILQNSGGTKSLTIDDTLSTFVGLVSGITPVDAANFVTKAYLDGGGGAGNGFLPLAGGTMLGNTIHNDNVKSIYGNPGNDLQIFHDSSNSYIQDAGIGRLILQTNYLEIQNAAGTEAIIEGIEDGAVILYHNSSKKFETTNTGVDVRGDITSSDGSGQLAKFANVGNDLVLTANAGQTNVTAKMLFKSSGSGGGTITTKMIIDESGNLIVGSEAANPYLAFISTGGNGNNERTRLYGYANGGTYGGGLKVETRNNSNVFEERFRIDNLGDANFYGGVIATKSQNATSSFTFQNLDTTGTSVRTHLNATGGNRSIRIEAIHNDYSYVVSNNQRMYFQTNGGSNNPLLLDGNNATILGNTSANDVTARDNMYVAAGQLYIGADNANVNNSFRQVVSLASGSFKLQSRESGTWTDAMAFDNSLNATFGGSVNITGGTTNSLNITTSGTQDTIQLDRATTDDNAITKYQTASANKWIVGLRNTGNDDFKFYSYGTDVDVLNLAVSTGNATFTGDLIIGTSGKGILLGGTGAANRLDDYEEGTFTPVLKFGGAEVGINYTAQNGVYTKVGRLVSFSIEIRLGSKGSSTGICTIENLPFTSANILGNYGAASVSFSTNFALAVNTCFTIDNATTIIRPRFDSSGSNANYTNSQWSDNSTLIIRGSYAAV